MNTGASAGAGIGGYDRASEIAYMGRGGRSPGSSRGDSMRCEARTHSGVGCARAALRGERLCASHAGRCGARPGNRNAMRHGLYSRSVSAKEKVNLAAANGAEGIDDEIGVTRLMIMRALRQSDVPLVAYARLVEALCRQLRLRRLLASEGANAQPGKIAGWFDVVATELGLPPGPGQPDDEAGGSTRPAPRRARCAHRSVAGADLAPSPVRSSGERGAGAGVTTRGARRRRAGGSGGASWRRAARRRRERGRGGRR
jgi:hypothetical protein